MTRDDVIRLAREAFGITEPDPVVPFGHILQWSVSTVGLERFAALVAAQVREECSKIADEYDDGRYRNMAEIIADKIRATSSRP